MKKSSIITATLLAAAAAVIARLLFAPGKGSNIRQKISQTGQGFGEYMKKGFDDIAESVSHFYDNHEDQSERLSRKAAAKTEEIGEHINQILN